MQQGLNAALEDLAPLADPVRRSVFVHLMDAGEPVTREDAAAALRISRPLATFHLERLLAAGLIEEVRDVARTGRRRGRPVKRYRATPRERSVSVPPRHYELVASVFTEALAAMDRPPAVDEAARAQGRRLGQAIAARRGSGATGDDGVAATEAVLRTEGYVPRHDGDTICLMNCPFDTLARRHRGVVCRTNLCLIEGLLDGGKVDVLRATLDPSPDRCCVILTRTDRDAPGDEAATEVRADPSPTPGQAA